MRHRAFTLVEVLVTIGIIVLLIGVALPVVSAARSKAAEARTRSDMQNIAIALAAYRDDFGDYPRVMEAQKAPGVDPIINDLGNPNVIYGAELLCWALVGPYQMFPAGPFQPGDGANGPGFRDKYSLGPGPDGIMGTADDELIGKVTQPYLNVDLYRIARDATFSRYLSILDHNGRQILYFTSRPGATIADASNATTGYAGRGAMWMWDLRDNEPPFARTMTDGPDRLIRFRTGLKADTTTGLISPMQTPTLAPFLLWAAGDDGLYGTSDDIQVTP